MAISVRRAADADRPVIEQLIQLYLYDMASEHPWPLEADGRYAYDFLDRFWQHPYILLSEEDIAGFALVIRGCPITGDPDRWFMAEFFVLRPYRRRGFGREAVRHLLTQHTGPWNIAVLKTNTQAQAFWQKALADYAPTTSPAFHDAEAWLVHSFSTPA